MFSWSNRPWYTTYHIQNIKGWIPLIYQEIIFGSVFIKITIQRLA
jgi:hypothetical protein